MATGAQLIDRVCQTSGLNITAASADRTLCLSFLQEAVDTLAVEAEVNFDPVQSISLTQGTATYTFGTSPFNVPTDLIAINQITVTDGALTNVPVENVTMTEIITRRQGAGAAQSSPLCYALDYPTIVFYPTPGAGTTLNLHYVADGATLADNSTALTFIPKAFQWGCIANYAIARAFQYKKDKGQANDYMDAFLNNPVNGLPGLRRWKNRVSGVNLPSDGSGRGFVQVSPSQDFGPFS